MTTEHEASRTLVKSPPELWAECSEAGSLARHLGEFGEITITRLEPETTVAWEGENASGTVRIEPSGWGTRVTLTARTQPQETASAVEELPRAEVPAIEEPPIVKEPPIEEPAIDPTAEEEKDATLEKAIEAPGAPVASDAGALRIRWRRITAPMRGLFRSRHSEAEPNHDVAAVDEPTGSVSPDVADVDPVPDMAEAEPTPDVAEAEPAMAEAEPTPDLAEDEPGSDVAEAELGSEMPVDAELVLTAALDSLGQAHHRPFSRA